MDSGVHQKCAEEENGPVESCQDCSARQDEDQAQHQRAEDAPEQDAMLIVRRYREVSEDHHKNEDIVNAQRLLDQVTSQKLQASLSAEPHVHSNIERQR